MLECDNLVKIYKTDETEVMALQGLELSIKKGELMAIIGKSGSGKSTLLNIIGGLEKTTAGKVLFKDRDISTFTEKEMIEYRKHNIGFVWQKSILNLLPYLTVIQNLEMNGTMNGMSRARACEKGLELLEQVGLSERTDSYPTQLSGGEQQRAAIAVSLMNEPEIILADEPTGAVDERTKDRIQELFRNLNRKLGITIIIVTHDVSLADKVDRVVMISDGKISTERILKEEYRLKLDELEGYNFEDLKRQGKDSHDEYQLLDRAGRVKLSEDMLKAAGINSNRVKISVVDKKIVISYEEDEEDEQI
ncbi:MAG: ABC transporter ATP-binding protein [Lachnospiraceae bacterium]|nr:ABC transporter ATP-binding protein [Lachnospiraceae bacterium]